MPWGSAPLFTLHGSRFLSLLMKQRLLCFRLEKVPGSLDQCMGVNPFPKSIFIFSDSPQAESILSKETCPRHWDLRDDHLFGDHLFKAVSLTKAVKRDHDAVSLAAALKQLRDVPPFLDTAAVFRSGRSRCAEHRLCVARAERFPSLERSPAKRHGCRFPQNSRPMIGV